jgi:hypothetical protein
MILVYGFITKSLSWTGKSNLNITFITKVTAGLEKVTSTLEYITVITKSLSWTTKSNPNTQFHYNISLSLQKVTTGLQKVTVSLEHSTLIIKDYKRLQKTKKAHKRTSKPTLTGQ